MSVIILDETVRARIKQVQEYCVLHRYTADMLKEVIAGQRPMAGDNPEHVVNLPGTGMRVVMSLEEQPSGLMWHVSASIPKPKAMPSPSLMALLFQEFGLDQDKVVNVWIEPFPGGTAINILTMARVVNEPVT